MPLKAINGYTDGDDVVFVVRDELGKRLHRIRNFEWYYYLDGSLRDVFKNDPNFAENFKKANGITKITTEFPYLKAHTRFTKVWENRGKFYFRNLENMGVKTFEADVNPLKRLMIDSLEYEVSDSYRVLFFDIETDDRPREGSTTNEIVIGERQILSLAGYENPETWFVHNGFDEIEILRAFFKRMKDYDVLIGWNSDSFDLPYIKARVEYHRTHSGVDLEREFDIDWRNFITVDLMWRFKHVYQHDTTLSSFSLQRVSTHFDIGSKIDLDKRRIWDIFKEDPELGRKYNLNDCELLYRLEQKLGIFNQMVAQARFCRTFLSQFWITELLDNLVLASGKERRIHLPTKFWTPKGDESYAGGYVLDPKPGFYLNINIFDYQSLYPNIIRTWNISPDTMMHEDNGNSIKGVKPGIFFDRTLKDPNDPDSYLGLLPRVVNSLLERRDSIKKLKAALVAADKKDSLEYQSLDRDEKIVKELGNSVYGTCGNERSRYFSIDLAESITLAGQHLIKFARDFFEGLGFTVCAGDTDSIMVALPEGSDPQAILEMYHTALKNHVKTDYGARECHIKFKHEKRFHRFINVIKKNYVGRVAEEGGKTVDYIYAKGLEFIKKDTIAYTRAQLKNLNQWLLYEDHDIGFYVKYIEDLRQNHHTREFTAEEICITKKISRDFEAYKATPPAHARLAKKMWEAGDKEFHVGMDIRHFILDSTNKENKAEFLKNFAGVFDKQHYWEKLIYPPLSRILSVVYPKHDWEQYEKSAIQRPKKPRAKPKRKKKGEVAETTELVPAGVPEDSEGGIPACDEQAA